MATYLEGAVDFIPQETPFSPNLNLIMSTLQYQQGLYEKGFQKLQKSARSVINSDVLNTYTKEKRKQILANAENALKNLPSVDLSLPQNVSFGNSLFSPFYEDPTIIHDISYTKQYKSARQQALALQNSDKEEQRNRFWTTGIQYLDNGAEKFSNASPEEMLDMRPRTYVAKPNIDDQILKLFGEGKLKVEWDSLSGQYKYTDTNGKQAIPSFANFYLALAENDPEAMQGFKVMGIVSRENWIKENTERLGSEQNAAKAYDEALVTDYTNTQTEVLKSTEEAAARLKTKLDALKKQVDAGEISEDDPRIDDIIRLKNEYAQLTSRSSKIRADIYSIDPSKPSPARERILGNPTSYVGQVALNKSALDLAQALAGFGGRKVDINPIFEKAVLPFKLKDYELAMNEQLEKIKTNEKLRELEETIKIKERYGIPLSGGSGTSGDGTGNGTGTGKGAAGLTKKQLDVPSVLESATGAAVAEKEKEALVNAYDAHIDKTDEYIQNVITGKMRFIETILNRSQMTDASGKPYTNEEFTKLRTNGADLNKLYEKAVTEFKTWKSTNPRYNEGLRMLGSVQNNNDIWVAANAFKIKTLKQVVGNLYGSDASKNFMYPLMVHPETGFVLDPTRQDHIDIFKNAISQTPEFKLQVMNNFKNGLKKMQSSSGYAPYMEPTPEEMSRLRQNEERVLLDQYVSKMPEYVEGIKKVWNSAGNEYNFFSKVGRKGGGQYTRELSYTASNTVAGEKADIYTQDLVVNVLSPFRQADEDNPYDDKNVMINYGNQVDVENSSAAQKAFEKIRPELLNSAKLGKDASLDTYTLSYQKIAGNNLDWSKYKITLSNEWLDKNTESKSTDGTVTKKLLTQTESTALRNGLVIYVNKDKDRSIISSATAVGEIEMLVEANDGYLKRDILPNKYWVDITKLATGGYKVGVHRTTYSVDATSGKVNEVPDYFDNIVPDGTDITQAYYDILGGLETYMVNATKAKEQYETNRDKPKRKITWSEIESATENY